ncbi:Crp/Fnr family transcriptional regulator [Gillisia sp. JM1]|uniref:Crp/Fnr family transcriptional regulator n=1 Tax=Gillisia sp. JM1 TaxID=1283286 RepID=UPI000684AE26|nr:Crp/Fnr family transcriptional regulator [Gillisia sp. JM1]
MSEADKIWYLENFNFFSELNLEERTFICQNTVMNSVEKGEALYFQNGPAKSVYFLKEGRMKISRFNDSGNEFLVALLGPGEIFGESSITGEKTRKDAAVAEEKSLYCIMKEKNMKQLLLRSPTLNFKFTQMIETRREKTEKRMEDLVLKNNTERIVDFLIDLAAKHGEGKTGVITIPYSFTHGKIAQLTSTNRQEVSSLFSGFKKKKIIEYNRKHIRILRVQDLQVPRLIKAKERSSIV